MKHLVATCLFAALGLAACGDNLTSDPAPVPSSSATAVVTPQGTAVAFSVAATSPMGKALTYTAWPAQHGTIAGTGPGFIYTPVKSFAGVEDLRVKISDGEHDVYVTVVITVAAETAAPVPGADTFITPEGQQLVLPPSALLANDSAFDPTRLQVASVQNATHGSVVMRPGMIAFTPEVHYSGPASFQYVVTDGTQSAIGDVHVAVSFVDTAPVAANDTATALENTPDAIPMAALLANDSDIDGQTLAITAVSSPTHGTVAIQGTDVVFTPDADYSGDASFQYTVSDGTLTDTGTVAVAVTFVDTAPVASDQSVTLDEDGSAAIALGATDADGQALTYAVTPPQHGTLSGMAPNLTYTPAQYFFGSDSFTFIANDGQLDSNIATVSITVDHVIVCGDGIVEGTEQCDDGNQVNGDGCENDCTITASGAVCGNGIVEAGEQCDDGNTVDGDGCSHLCVVEYCGDGQIDLGLGEQCDDGNTVDGDGCSSTCQIEAGSWPTTAPVAVAAGCTTGTPNSARMVAVDASGTIYAVMLCPGTASVVVSTDHGQTFTAPMDLGETNVALVAAGAGGAGYGYVAMILNDGTVKLRTTSDHGATWSPAQVLGASMSTSAGLSLEGFNNTVYVGFESSDGVMVMRSFDGGATFASTDVQMMIAFFDVLYDRVNGTVIVATDTPDFHVRASSDQGATFAAEANPPGQEFYSDWAIGNGEVFVSGSMNYSSEMFVIPTSDLTASTSVSGLPSVDTPQYRVVAAAVNGDAFAGSELDSGGVQLDRLPYGATAFDAPRVLSATGTGIVIGALPGSAGAVAEYVDGGTVYVTVQGY
jgi:cysteine-rich repeat protein